MKAVLIIVGILALVWFFYEVFTSKPIPKEYLGVFIGGLGSGKTYLAHRRILEWYRREYRDYKWSCFFHPFNKKKRREKPYVYSNIPLRIGNRFNKRMSEVLTKEILFLEEPAAPCSAFLFDELGQVANQYTFDLPAVKFNVQTHIRFMRQFYKNGDFEATEQCTDFVAKPIRGRFNIVINLRKLHRIGFLPFGKVYWQQISMTQDITNVSDVMGGNWNKWFFWMPYGRRYDSKPYSNARIDGFTHIAPDKWEWNNLKTNYIIDVSQPCYRDIYQSITVKVPQSNKKEKSKESTRGGNVAPSRALEGSATSVSKSSVLATSVDFFDNLY